MADSVFSDFIVRARDQFTGPMRNMQRGVTAFGSTAQRQLGGVSQSMDRMRRVMQFATGALVTGFVARGIRGLITAASDVEGVTVQFETLTGSMENATRLIRDMQQFAASTPLQFDTLAEGTQRLLAFGITQEDVLGTLQMLGDAALGDANKLDSLVRAYGKVSARGRASMEEINMVIDAGVPIMAALNEEFGTTTEELTQMISAGRVSSDVFTAAFRRMTSEGGQFHNGMQRQSQTTAGLFSTLKDNIQLTAASIGAALLPTAKDLTEQLIAVTEQMRNWVGQNEELIRQRVEDTISGIKSAVDLLTGAWNNGLIPAILYGIATFKALNLIISLSTTLIAAAGTAYATFKTILFAFSAVAGGAATVMEALNLVLAANPIGAIVIAIAAAVAGVVLLIRNWDRLVARFRRNRDVLSSPEATDYSGTAIALGVDPVTEPRTMYGMPTGAVSTQTIENRSTVDVNFGGMPPGASIRQSGRAPGFNLAVGYQAAAIMP